MRLFNFLRKLASSPEPETPAVSGRAEESAGAFDAVVREDLVRQDFLAFREGASDKVYHLELRREAADLFSVWFEYGRRGTALQSGFKTPNPVDLEAAEKAYNALLNEKTKKGYQLYSGPEQGKAPIRTRSNPKARNKAILAHLALAARAAEKQADKNWPLSRVVWRAGALRLADALPSLATLLQQPAPENPVLMQYCTLWAISRCAMTASEIQKSAVRPALQALLEKDGPTNPPQTDLNPLLYEAGLAVFDASGRALLCAQLLAALPPAFQHYVQQQQGDTLLLTLQDYVENRPKSQFSFVETLYLLTPERPFLRPTLLWFVRQAPFKPGFFKVLRHVFKMAELRCDAEVFGILTQRFTLELPGFTVTGDGSVFSKAGRWQGGAFQAELVRPDSRLAFSHQTRSWFIRRSWQTLLGTLELEDDAYVRMAAGVLLAFDDKLHKSADSWTARSHYNKKTKRWDSIKTILPAYGEFPAFFYILRGAHSQYQLKRKGLCWTISEQDYQKIMAKGGEPAPHLERWDACPQAYVHLLAESKSALVQAFALRRLAAHPQRAALTARFDTALLGRLLDSPYLPTALFALQLVIARFEGQRPDRELVLQMLGSIHAPICEQGHVWLRSHLRDFAVDTAFVFRLMTHTDPAVRQQMQQSMPDLAATLSEAQQQALVGRVLAGLLALEAADEALATELMVALQTWAAGHLSKLGPALLLQLLQHPLEAVAVFGANLASQKPNHPETLPDAVLQCLLDTEIVAVRGVGISILDNLTNEALLRREVLLTTNLAHPHPAVRASIHAALVRALVQEPALGTTILGICLRLLLRKETAEGVHDTLRQLVEGALSAELPGIDRKMIFRLLNSEQVAANDLAALLIQRFVAAESLSVRNIVRLGEHELASVRQLCWQMFTDNVARMRYEREDALRLLESEWDDTRAFAFEFFQAHFGEREWTPELLIGICDNGRPDIQALGRTLCAQYLREADGPEFLLRLSQHPRPEMQAFAAQYLEQYASGKVEYLEQLTFYCLTVLSQVNKSRKAKDLVFAFLEREAQKSEKSAQAVEAILHRIAVTDVAVDKEKCIELLSKNSFLPQTFTL